MRGARAAALLLLAAPYAAAIGDPPTGPTHASEQAHSDGKSSLPDQDQTQVIDVSEELHKASVFERDAQGHVVGVKTTAGGGGTGSSQGHGTVSAAEAEELTKQALGKDAVVQPVVDIQGASNIDFKLLTLPGQGSPMPYLTPQDLGPGVAKGVAAGVTGGLGGAKASGRSSDDSGASVGPRLEAAAAQAEAGGQEGRASLLNAYAGQPEKAERQAAQALARDSGDKQALTAMMVVRQRQGRADEAKELARRALAADPDNALAKIIAGHGDSLSRGETLSKKLSKLDLGKTAETSGLGGGALGLPGAAATGESAGRGAATAEAGAGTPPAGGAVVRPAPPMYDLTQPLTPAQELVVRAVRKHEIGDDQGAMLALTEAIDRDPKDAGAFVVRAEVDNSLLKYAEAVLDATRAVELAPTKLMLTARALRARAYARLELKQWVEALADASRAVEQDPQSGLGYLYRAMAEDKLGRGTAASDDVAKAVKLDPALAPLAKPLLAKYGLQTSPSSVPARGRALLFGALGLSAALLAFGLRKLFVAQRLTTTAAKRLMESTPLP